MTLPQTLAGQLSLALFAGPLIVAALWDAVKFRIPNILPLFMVGGFVVAALAGGLGLSGWGSHLASGLMGLVLGLVGFHFKVFGGGDGKLLAAAALWAGLPSLLVLVILTGLFGGMLAILILTLRRTGVSLGLTAHGLHLAVLDPSGPMPYGLAIAPGAMVALYGSPLFL